MTLKIGLDISALDASFKEHAARGIGRYVSHLSYELNQFKTPEVDLDFFDHRELTSDLFIDRAIDMLPFGRHTVRQQLFYPYRLSMGKMKGFDALHFPAHMDAPSWCPKPYILTVLDLIPIVCADLYTASSPNWRFKLARFLELKAIRNARLICAISENTKKDVHNLLGVSEEKIVVTPLGVDRKYFDAQELSYDFDDLRNRLNIPATNKVILYVGGIDPRKNYLGLINTYKEVVSHFAAKGDIPPVLLIAGKIQNDKEFPKLSKLILEAGIESLVIMPGYVEDDDLLGLYRMSDLFLFTSLYEGFGLTPLEAMATGTAVVSSNTSAMPEVLGDAALMVDPLNIPECAEAVISLLTNSELAHEYGDRGIRRARLFSWSNTAKTTFEAYQLFAGQIS